MSVIFGSVKPLNRAENIKAVYDAWDGDKTFVRLDPLRRNEEVLSAKGAVYVVDEFPNDVPPGGTTIMIGHGIAGGKTYGLDQPRPYITEKTGGKLTWVVTSSAATVTLAARQSGVPEQKVLALGMPRTDAYIGRKKGDGCTALTDHRAYLYAPTFLDAGEQNRFDIDFDRINSMLSDDEVLYVKPHMVTKTILKGQRYRRVMELPADMPTTPFLLDCDVLITDYSSIVFDAHVLRKPVVLFAKRTNYLATRGMYMIWPEEYAARHCDNEEALVDMIRHAKKPLPPDESCRVLTAGACDGHATERVIELIRRSL